MLQDMSDQEIEQQLSLWAEHPVTKLVKKILKEDLEDMLQGKIQRTVNGSPFDYDIGHKDGQMLTIFSMLKPDSMVKTYVNILRNQKEYEANEQLAKRNQL